MPLAMMLKELRLTAFNQHLEGLPTSGHQKYLELYRLSKKTL